MTRSALLSRRRLLVGSGLAAAAALLAACGPQQVAVPTPAPKADAKPAEAPTATTAPAAAAPTKPAEAAKAAEAAKPTEAPKPTTAPEPTKPAAAAGAATPTPAPKVAMPAAKPGAKPLVVWGPVVREDWGGILKNFAEQNPDLEVKPENAPGEDPAKIVAAVSAGAAPDIYYAGRHLVPEFSSRGALKPLNDLINTSKNFKMTDLWPKLRQDVTYKGKVWAVPLHTDVRAYYWNKNAFKEAGLDPEKAPKTWEEATELGLKLYKASSNGQLERLGFTPVAGNPPGFLAWYIFLWQRGGEFVSDDFNKVTFNADAGIDSLQWMVDVVDKQGGMEKNDAFVKGLTPGQGQDGFMIGKIASYINGNWQLTPFKKFAPDLNYGLARLPTFEKFSKEANYAGGFTYAMPNGGKNPEGGWKLIEFWMSPEIQVRWANELDAVPSVERAAREEWPKQDARRKVFVDETAVAKWVPVIPAISEIFTENARMVDQALRKQKTAKEAVQESSGRVQQILDRTKNLRDA
ncbi:MAG TPA: ABC transporter substrate-binding protein [Chloroflexota bacterium]|jgi:multiple sugar transport system substrate-binding protein